MRLWFPNWTRFKQTFKRRFAEDLPVEPWEQRGAVAAQLRRNGKMKAADLRREADEVENGDVIGDHCYRCHAAPSQVPEYLGGEPKPGQVRGAASRSGTLRIADFCGYFLKVS